MWERRDSATGQNRIPVIDHRTAEMAAAAGGDEEAPPSPNSGRLKLLCSYGGKILPRPLDGQLKYVGGETRVLAVPRSVSFAELKGRIGSMFEAREVAVKYQLAPEELDVLVSVTCDEDLAHMLDEYDRSCPAAATLLPLSSPPSAGNSPTSSSAVRCGAGRGMHRVRSTPNLGGSGSGSGSGPGPAHNFSGPLQYYYYSPYHHYSGPGRNVGGFGGFGGGAQRYDVCRCGCGCGCRVAWGPQQPPTPRGHYALGTGGGGGCACVGHVDDGAHLPPRSGPSAVPTRKMTIWE
ncbi:uncharacterized protein LOC109706495 [Ananas comosus]|uniref:Uncharacterized protein LOC109706495 n=1 Tax=Ananas comosus TaxID=4615 RepID=A0A6P5EHN9_ANACO|nr:uncharacterized protein LOC109706495 [Ananas comosus]